MSASEGVSLLVAAVGTSDIRPATPSDSRAGAGGKRGTAAHARAAGLALIEQLERGEQVCYEVPILVPIVAGLEREGRLPDRVLLIATDQPETAPAPYRASDTWYYGMLAARRLQERFPLAPESIELVPYRENPADYGTAFPFMRALFGRLHAEPAAGPTTCYLAPTGGTPALTAALLIEGVATYGAQARVRYLDRGADTARTLDVAQDLQAQALRRALLAHIGAHAYAAAGTLCDGDPAFATLLPDANRRSLVRALLDHAAQRLNANLDEALTALDGVDTTLLPDDQRQALALLPETASEQELDAQTLREVIASAEVMYELGHYFDFITRAGTFMDTCCKYVAQHCFGAQPTPIPNKPGKVTLEPWVRANAGLLSYLEEKEARLDEPTQHLYKLIIAYLAKGNQSRKRLHKAVSDQRFNRLSTLRNGCVHRFDGITVSLLGTSWDGDPREIIAQLRQIAQLAGIVNVDHNPYRAIQDALRSLLHEPAGRWGRPL